MDSSDAIYSEENDMMDFTLLPFIPYLLGESGHRFFLMRYMWHLDQMNFLNHQFCPIFIITPKPYS